MAFHGSLNRAVLKSEVCVGFKGAVFQDKVFAVAQGLASANVAANQLQVLCVPAQELSLDAGVVDRYVLALPECVLGIEVRVTDDYVLGVLEGVVALQLEVIHLDVVRVHEDVVGIDGLYILEGYFVAVPESLLGVGELHVFQVGTGNAAEHLRGLDEGVVHLAVPRVPQRGACALAEDAVFDGESVALPEGILALEFTIYGLDVLPFLEGGFTGADDYVFQTETVLFTI